MNVEKKYNEMRQRFCNGGISRAEWHEFCILVLEYLMKINKDILKNLKEW